MAEYTYDQLHKMTVAQLRDLVPTLPNQEALEGYSTMHKDHLLPLMCKVLGIHIHAAAAGTEKSKLKARIHQLQAKRDEATAAGKGEQLSAIRQQIHVLKRKLRHLADEAQKHPAAPAAPAARRRKTFRK